MPEDIGYLLAYNYKTKKFAPDKYVLELEQRQNMCKAKFADYHDKKIYSEGYLICNDEIVFVVMENYKPTSSIIDVLVLEINICNGTEELMIGGYFGTNAKLFIFREKYLDEIRIYDKIVDRKSTK